MLAYRHELLRRDLEAHARYADAPPLRVAVTGASGLIGRALVPFLTTGGHARVSGGAEAAPARASAFAGTTSRGRDRRGRSSKAWMRWSTSPASTSARAGRGTPAPDPARAGSSAPGSWPKRSPGSPAAAVLVSASAIGIYGNRGDETPHRSERHPGAARRPSHRGGRGWEAATEPARAAGHPRGDCPGSASCSRRRAARWAGCCPPFASGSAARWEMAGNG